MPQGPVGNVDERRVPRRKAGNGEECGKRENERVKGLSCVKGFKTFLSPPLPPPPPPLLSGFSRNSLQAELFSQTVTSESYNFIGESRSRRGTVSPKATL